MRSRMSQDRPDARDSSHLCRDESPRDTGAPKLQTGVRTFFLTSCGTNSKRLLLSSTRLFVLWLLFFNASWVASWLRTSACDCFMFVCLYLVIFFGLVQATIFSRVLYGIHACSFQVREVSRFRYSSPKDWDVRLWPLLGEALGLLFNFPKLSGEAFPSEPVNRSRDVEVTWLKLLKRGLAEKPHDTQPCTMKAQRFVATFALPTEPWHHEFLWMVNVSEHNKKLRSEVFWIFSLLDVNFTPS